MAILTFTRQPGSIGDEIGMMIARRLGYTFFDRKEIEKRIIEKGFPLDKFRKYDERKPRFFDNFDRDRDEYLNYLQKVIYEMARQNNCVIVGRGAFLFLSGVKNHVALRFVSSDKDRLAHIKETQNITDDKQAQKWMEDADKRQASFYKSYFKYSLIDHNAIHATVNTSLVPPEMLTDMLVAGIKNNVTPEIEKLGEARVDELILAQEVTTKIVTEHKLPIDELWVRVDGKTMQLYGLTASSAIVERAITIINTDFPGYDVHSFVRCVQDFRNSGKQILSDKFHKLSEISDKASEFNEKMSEKLKSY